MTHPEYNCEYCGVYHTSWSLQTKGKLEHNHTTVECNMSCPIWRDKNK